MADSLSEELRGWLTGRLPQDWSSSAAPEVSVDREEITITVPLTAPETAAGASDDERAAAARGRAQEFRERTRERRIEIARELERRTGRKVAWAVQVGEHRETFTSAAVPVMTRLRQPQRQVLDTLVDAGVARSRADALAWCVRLVGRHSEEWLGELRGAMSSVDEVRRRGPDASG